jgi:hypothetical protein
MNFTVNLPINDEEKLEEHRLLYLCKTNDWKIWLHITLWLPKGRQYVINRTTMVMLMCIRKDGYM